MNPLLLSIPIQVETERLILRSYHAGDGPWYFEMSQRNKSHLTMFESGNAVVRIRKVEDAEEIVREFEELWRQRRAFFLGAFDKETGKFVAQIYIGIVSWELPEFELGYFSDVEHEGKGYVTEAARKAVRFTFDYLGAHRIRIECDDTNDRSSRVAERCGFVKEGHIRENKKNLDGSLSGTFHFGLLRRELDSDIS